MSTEITRKEAEAMKDDLKRAYGRLATIKEEMKESLGFVRQTMEVGLTVFAVSWALAKWGGQELTISLIGIPVELGAALIIKGVAFSGLLDGYSSDAHNIGDGLLSVYLAKKGFSMGRAGGTWSQGLGNPNAAGALPAAGGGYGPLSDAEMARAMAS